MLLKEIFEYESKKSKLKFTIHIIINIKKEIREDCEKQDAKNRLNIFVAIFYYALAAAQLNLVLTVIIILQYHIKK